MVGLTGLKGAIYFPSRSFNHYQTWADYDRRTTHQDLVSAADLNLDALRVLIGYEFWRDNPDEFRRVFDNFLELADRLDIQILPVLFESIGAPPTENNMTDDDVTTSFAVRSPHKTVVRNEDKWDGPRAFVEWFTARYGGRDTVPAVEIMNEPGGWTPRVNFCREMLRAARNARPDVPLTMGCKDFRFNQQYSDPGLDVHQFHYNLPPTAADMREKLREAEAFSADTGKPIWLTEWQRTRRDPPDKMLPNYSSLASTIYESDVDGDFFWQLMLKPAYIETPRKQGRLNGLVHEDGEVYSAEDARAISGEDYYQSRHRKWPEWAKQAERQWAR